MHLFADLGLEHLIEDALQELGKVAIAAKESLQGLGVQGNLILGHGCPLWLNGLSG